MALRSRSSSRLFPEEKRTTREAYEAVMRRDRARSMANRFARSGF